MQWIKTKSIHAAEFFHGTLELLENGMSMILLYGEDETRLLMDRVLNFSKKITDQTDLRGYIVNKYRDNGGKCS